MDRKYFIDTMRIEMYIQYVEYHSYSAIIFYLFNVIVAGILGVLLGGFSAVLSMLSMSISAENTLMNGNFRIIYIFCSSFKVFAALFTCFLC
jgi:hypothetical protein